jgi:hypothetical protein
LDYTLEMLILRTTRYNVTSGLREIVSRIAKRERPDTDYVRIRRLLFTMELEIDPLWRRTDVGSSMTDHCHREPTGEEQQCHEQEA